MVETPAEILAKKVLYRASDFTARDIFDLAFLIEKGEAEILREPAYRPMMDIILTRIDRHAPALRQSFDQIARTGYTADYAHCTAIIRQFVATLDQ